MFNNKNVNIQFNRMPGENIKVEHFISPIPFPKAPYVIDSIGYPPFTPDRINKVSFRELQNFRLEEKGLYFFQLNPSDTAGCLVGYFSPDFPRINKVGQMIAPIKYISSDEAYLNIIAQTNKKLAIDNFWLRISGSTDGARELIRIYYSRALFANFYFTDITEGWRTDRGMIYMIFGNPDKITRLNTEERWSYNRNPRSLNIVFHFKQISSKLSTNIFRLERDSKYKNIWDQAVNSWKSGIPFSFTN
jgi:GWxTD domain-containing protein